MNCKAGTCRHTTIISEGSESGFCFNTFCNTLTIVNCMTVQCCSNKMLFKQPRVMFSGKNTNHHSVNTATSITGTIQRPHDNTSIHVIHQGALHAISCRHVYFIYFMNTSNAKDLLNTVFHLFSTSSQISAWS